MCMVNNDDRNYELILSDLDDNTICSIFFKSVTSVCRFLEECDLTKCIVDVVRMKDTKLIDVKLLLDVWKGISDEVQNKRLFD